MFYWLGWPILASVIAPRLDRTEQTEWRRKRREAVRRAYSAVARAPTGSHPFPVGRDFAADLGYPEELLKKTPAAATDAFTGVSNVGIAAEIPPGSRVLDLGCGAGLDSLIAAQRTGPEGSVAGVDFSEAMIERARRAAAAMRITNVEFREAPAEDLPVADGSIDVALVNGLFNLNPARTEMFRELARVVRPGGGAFVAEIILLRPLPEGFARNESNWFA